MNEINIVNPTNSEQYLKLSKWRNCIWLSKKNKESVSLNKASIQKIYDFLDKFFEENM